MSPKSLDLLAIQLNEELLAFRRKRRFMEIANPMVPDRIGSTETSLLLLIEGRPALTIRDVATSLEIEQSWMSRIVAALEEQGLVKITIPDSDKRSRVLNLTSAGSKALAASLSFETKLVEQCLSILSPSQIKEVVNFIKLMADSLSAQKFVGHEDAHPLTMELSRLNQSFRLHAGNYLGTGFTIFEIQALVAINGREGKDFYIKDLEKILPLDPSSLSRMITKLESDKVVSKKRSPTDKRAFLLSLTNEGSKIIERYYDEVKARFKLATRNIPESEILDFLRLMRNINQSSNSLNTNESISLKELGPEEVQSLKAPWRTFINQSKRSNDKAKVLGVFLNKTMLGVINVDSKISVLLNDLSADNLKQIAEAYAN